MVTVMWYIQLCCYLYNCLSKGSDDRKYLVVNDDNSNDDNTIMIIPTQLSQCLQCLLRLGL